MNRYSCRSRRSLKRSSSCLLISQSGAISYSVSRDCLALSLSTSARGRYLLLFPLATSSVNSSLDRFVYPSIGTSRDRLSSQNDWLHGLSVRHVSQSLFPMYVPNRPYRRGMMQSRGYFSISRLRFPALPLFLCLPHIPTPILCIHFCRRAISHGQ